MKQTNLAQHFPDEVNRIFEIFLKEGDEIRLVGGCVRDLLVGKAVHDFDFATKLVPDDIIAVLEEHKVKAIPTGKKFGTITAVVNRKNFEITTLRKDLNNDGRHCEPEFVDDYLLDASRRDFTINALYLDDKGNIFDYFDGLSDLENKKVRFIGDANARIEEDYLRILRFFRFSCDYANELDEEGFVACVKEKKNLRTLSRERVRIEFLKLISSQNRQNIIKILQKIDENDVSKYIFSMGCSSTNLEKLFEIENKYAIEADIELKIAALFVHHITDLKAFATELCATNKEKKLLQYLLSNIDHNIDAKQLKIRLAFDNQNYVKALYIINLMNEIDENVQSNIAFLNNFSLPDFPLNGNDLKKCGMIGKEISQNINKAKKFWAVNDFHHTKDELLKFLNL